MYACTHEILILRAHTETRSDAYMRPCRCLNTHVCTWSALLHAHAYHMSSTHRDTPLNLTAQNDHEVAVAAVPKAAGRASAPAPMATGPSCKHNVWQLYATAISLYVVLALAPTMNGLLHNKVVFVVQRGDPGAHLMMCDGCNLTAVEPIQFMQQLGNGQATILARDTPLST